MLEQGTGAGAVELDAGLAEQTVKNLTFATVVLLQTAAASEHESEDGSEDGSEDDDDDDAEKVPSDGRGRRRRTRMREKDDASQRPPLAWLFVGWARLARAAWARRAPLRFDGAPPSPRRSAPKVSRETRVRGALLLPAVLCADEAVVGVAEEHRELAREALEVMRSRPSGGAFGRAFAAVQKRIAGQAGRETEDEGVGGCDGPGARAKLVEAGQGGAKREKRKSFETEGSGQSSKRRFSGTCE